MKFSIPISIIILSAFIFTGCNDGEEITKAKSIEGTWSLKNVSGGLIGINLDYEDNIVTWEFLPETQNLIVTSSIINTGPQSVFLPLQSGSYVYDVIEFDGKSYLQIEGQGNTGEDAYGRYEINDDGELIIDQGEIPNANISDVFVLVFE